MKSGVAKGGLRSFRAPVIQVKIVFPGEAHPAVDLNAAIAHRAARVARVQLGDGHRRSGIGGVMLESPCGVVDGGTSAFRFEVHVGALVLHRLKNADGLSELFSGLDRKSTRLNSSHEWISYAVFCLKKKKKNIIIEHNTVEDSIFTENILCE